jgi:hypothetical protein
MNTSTGFFGLDYLKSIFVSQPKFIPMKKRFLFSVTLLLAGCMIASAHNPTKKNNDGNPGNDSIQKESGHAKGSVITKPVPPAAKAKINIPVKKSDTYEMKAPSIFTFTVLSTYLNMPLQKK